MPTVHAAHAARGDAAPPPDHVDATLARAVSRRCWEGDAREGVAGALALYVSRARAEDLPESSMLGALDALLRAHLPRDADDRDELIALLTRRAAAAYRR